MNAQALEDRIYDAFVFGLPIYELARTRHADLSGAQGRPPLAPNTLHHGRDLSGADDRWITTPNNDTLYSRAWLDLSHGPLRVSVLAQPAGRYWSVALMDATTRHVALLGQRLHGAGPVQATLVGPDGDARGITGEVVRAPGQDVWLLARWIVEGTHDLDAARAMQDRLILAAPPRATPTAVTPTTAMDPANFLAVVAEQLVRNPLQGRDREWVSRLADVGLEPGSSKPWEQLPRLVRDAWTGRVAECHARVGRAFIGRRRQVDGWWVADGHLGDGDAGYEWRAGIALAGLGALDAIEAVYAARTGDDAGAPLHGRHAYRLTVPPTGIPAGAFWSLSLYELMPDGRRYLAHNAIGRYSIGDRTLGVCRQGDGSLRIELRQAAPDDSRERANWLPAPNAPFSLTLRAYLPSEELRRWKVALPKLGLCRPRS